MSRRSSGLRLLVTAKSSERAIPGSRSARPGMTAYLLAAVRGGVLPSSTAIAEINGFMKKASLAG